jgi:hypothetical protein
MSRRRIPAVIIGALTALALVTLSAVPVAAASPTVTLATSVSGTSATVTVDLNRGTNQIASCAYVLGNAAAVSCGTAEPVGSKASRYTLDLAGQSVGSHTVTVTIVLTDHGTASGTAAYTIANTETDTDADGVPDAIDNCPTIANADQANHYGSAKGDACEDTNGDGILDVNEADMCVSVDGVLILRAGTAKCFSDPSGTSPNIAVANGSGAEADALNGNNNTATAIGSTAFAIASDGNDNTASATGTGATASAETGDNNTATAIGDGAQAFAFNGNGNIATAIGTNVEADAFAPNGCTWIAPPSGSCSS